VSGKWILSSSLTNSSTSLFFSFRGRTAFDARRSGWFGNLLSHSPAMIFGFTFFTFLSELVSIASEVVPAVEKLRVGGSSAGMAEAESDGLDTAREMAEAVGGLFSQEDTMVLTNYSYYVFNTYLLL
jgi:hypothetical protein